MKLEQALLEAQEYEDECVAALNKDDETWQSPDSELGKLENFPGAFKKTSSGVFADAYLQWLINGGVVEVEAATEDISK